MCFVLEPEMSVKMPVMMDHSFWFDGADGPVKLTHQCSSLNMRKKNEMKLDLNLATFI